MVAATFDKDGMSGANRNIYVDRLRGVASLGVVLSHASGYGFANIISNTVPHGLAVSVAANAYHAVSLFFVISGFLITGKLLKAKRTGSSAGLIASFYRDRIARIYPCLVLMIVCGLALAACGWKPFVLDWSKVPELLRDVFTFRFNIREYPLPRIWDPLWSLSIEEMFYLLFPLAFILIRRTSWIAAALAAIIVAGPLQRWNAADAVGNVLTAYSANFGEIAIGVGTALVTFRLRRVSTILMPRRVFRWLGSVVIAVTFCLTQDALKAAPFGPEFVGAGAALYLFGSDDACTARSTRAWSVLESFGRLSFEIYLFHMFFLEAVGTVLALSWRTAANAVVFDDAASLIYLAGLLLICALVSRFYSEPANRLIRQGTGWVDRLAGDVGASLRRSPADDPPKAVPSSGKLSVR